MKKGVLALIIAILLLPTVTAVYSGNDYRYRNQVDNDFVYSYDRTVNYYDYHEDEVKSRNDDYGNYYDSYNYYGGSSSSRPRYTYYRTRSVDYGGYSESIRESGRSSTRYSEDRNQDSYGTGRSRSPFRLFGF